MSRYNNEIYEKVFPRTADVQTRKVETPVETFKGTKTEEVETSVEVDVETDVVEVEGEGEDNGTE